MEKFNDNISSYFPGRKFRTLIPPFNNYNGDTLTAMERTGYNILSAQCSQGNCPHEGDIVSTPAYVPVGASTGGWGTPYQIQPAATVFKEIKGQIDQSGGKWSAVMMHPQEFSVELTPVVNEEAIQILKELIEMCLDARYELVTFTQLVDSVAERAG
ncbi:MAG TPA: hypothetical protein EYP59_05005 [Thiotrichaceae bacterium]|nr:hypothetical protein [Thiotrichaceae bacterium]